MFRLTRLELVHWDYWQRFVLPLDGDIVTIVGPNGSGKTTLLDALRTLLAIPCSTKREYKRYVRRSGQPLAWLRTVVGNGRGRDGHRPFFPILEEEVTLACRIRKRGGEWQRRYVVAAGDVAIEALDAGREAAPATAGACEWMGVRDYQQRLATAGLTAAMKRVLSLEQGETDKLCEYAPRALLELVFDVFGDGAVLEEYRNARVHQREAEGELTELEGELGRLDSRLEALISRANRYQEWRRLRDEATRLVAEVIPRLELAEQREAIVGAMSHLLGVRRDLATRGVQIACLVAEVEATAEAESEARDRLAVGEGALAGAQAHHVALRERLAATRPLLAERDRLTALAAEAGAVDAGRLTSELEAARHEEVTLSLRRQTLRERRVLLRGRCAALEGGAPDLPPAVAEFCERLTSAGIAYHRLPELVEVRDPAWQAAVEGLLAPYRHLLLLDRPGDAGGAWALGEQARYRHFVVAERGDVGPVPPESLRAVVDFRAAPPRWLAELLAAIRCVESVGAGAALAPEQAWITPEGYHREGRGGRFLGVAPSAYRLGEAGRRERLAGLCRELAAVEEEFHEVEAAQAATTATIAHHQALLAGVDAARDLGARAAAFRAAEAEVAEMEPDERQLAREVAAAKAAVTSARATVEQAHDCHTRAALAHEREVAAVDDLLARQGNQRREQVERILAYRARRTAMPLFWRDRDAQAAVRREYESAAAARRDLERLQQRLAEEEWETEETVLAHRDKVRGDRDGLATQVEQRRAHLDRARGVADEARGAYINVLRATVRRYGRNVRSLGELAAIGVEVEPPHLENDDTVLAQAGLAVRFDFDHKGPIGMDDGEASGGQQVMKSMILLMGLLMEEGSEGGFVFIDEPFAHLDIANIERVARFLTATRSQYLITTPITHNSHIFDPSRLTLVTQKKRPGDGWAPPVMYLRRDGEGATHGRGVVTARR